MGVGRGADWPGDSAADEHLVPAVTSALRDVEDIADGRVALHLYHDVDAFDGASRIPSTVRRPEIEHRLDTNRVKGSDEVVPDLGFDRPHSRHSNCFLFPLGETR